MKRVRLLLLLAVACGQTWGQKTSVCSPDSLLKVEISVDGGRPSYTVKYKGKTFLEESPAARHATSARATRSTG